METAREQAKEGKKQLPLRLSASLWAELSAWAKDDFRSLNGQIEYLLSESVKKRGRGARGEGRGARIEE